MPFFQGAYNFEVHGGSFHDSRRHRRQRQRTTPSHPPSEARESPRRSTSIPSQFVPTLIHSDTTNSEKTIDDEAQTIQDTPGCCQSLWTSLTSTLPCQVYMQLLLRLPSHYFNRVDRLSRDANMALKEILDLAVRSNSTCGNDFQAQILDLGQHTSPFIAKPESLPPAYRHLTVRWGCFIDDLLEEWRTLNLVSALLVPGILTIFQVTGAGNDPVTRYLAFWSLISALLSLLYGCAFIIQFSRMRKPSIAIEWAFEAQNSRSTLWSVWVMLSLPVVWLAWSIVAFIVSIMAFMWRSGANPPNLFPSAPSTEFAFRIFVSAVLGIGVLYGILISMSFQRYGPTMDEALSRRIDAYIASAASSSSISQSVASTPNTPRNQDPIFLKSSSQKPMQVNTNSNSPRTRSISPLSSIRPPRTSLQQNPSTVPYQPSPLSSASPVVPTELSTSPTTHKLSGTISDKVSDSVGADELVDSGTPHMASMPPKPSTNHGVIGLDFSESTGSSQTMAPSSFEDMDREQDTGYDGDMKDRTSS